MRKSQMFVLGALGFLAVIIIIVVVMGRIAMGPVDQWEDSGGFRVLSGDETEESIELQDFDSVVVRGTWSVDIRQGSEWSIDLTYPEEFTDDVWVSLEGDVLVLDMEDFRSHDDARFFASLVVPELVSVVVEGAADISLYDVDTTNLNVVIAGAAQMESDDGRVENLGVRIEGAGRVDFSRLESVNAHVELEGAGAIKVNMAGGDLSGSLEGIGSIKYRGTIRENRVNISGLGRVERD